MNTALALDESGWQEASVALTEFAERLAAIAERHAGDARGRIVGAVLPG